jgi:glycosyltransferase involved in cell wall biosynthesis
LTARAGVDVAGYDVVHAHLSVVAPFTAPLAAAAAHHGTPTVVTVHSLWSRLGPVPGIAVQLAGLRRAPVSWTAVSAVAARALSRHLPRGTTIGLLPNAADVPGRLRDPDVSAGRSVRLVSAMRIARRKRPEALLRIFASLKESTGLPVELVIVGDGPLRSRVEVLSDRAGLGGAVRVTGRLDPDEVFTLFAASDVYVAPAVLESFGLAALEARSVGLPVVGRCGTGLEEFVRDGIEGLLCDSDEDMVRGLVRLVSDTGLRNRLAIHNRLTRTSRTWQNSLDAHELIYARAARHPTANPPVVTQLPAR